MMSKTLAGLILGVSGALAAMSAGAAITWDFSASTQAALNAGTFGNTRAVSSGGVTSTASAWSNTVGTTNVTIGDAYLGLYGTSGLGVTNRDGNTVTTNCTSGGAADNCEGTPVNTISPEHAIDNNERTDSVLFHFSSAVDLEQVTIGFNNGGDADISVLASNGAALSGQGYSGLVAAGWTVIGNYANLQVNTPKSIANSNFWTDWLIVAYNPTFGTGTSLDAGNDYFKILSVTGSQPGRAPEPGTALLLGAAAFAFWRARAARQKL